LSVAVTDVLALESINWEWTVEILKPDESWRELDEHKPKLEVDQPWVVTPAPTPTPTITITPTPMGPKATSTPTHTPTPTLLPAPTLRKPAEDARFNGRHTDVVFEWSEVGLSGADEYYVLIIEHKKGSDFTWTKNNTYDASWNSEDMRKGKAWLSQPDIGPDLKWHVVIACTKVDNPNDDGYDNGINPNDPNKAELRSNPSKTYHFHWHNGGGGDDDDDDDGPVIH